MVQTRIECSRRWVLFAIALVGIGIAHGQNAAVATQAARAPPPAAAGVPVSPAGTWPAASDRQLEAVRGGFDVGNGLLASFGIERVVYINGNLVTQVSVTIPDVARMTTAQADALAAAIGTVNIQIGPGNTLAPAMLDRATAALVIQNSLDDQDIKSLTTINASVNNLSQFSSIRLANSLQSALIGSLGH